MELWIILRMTVREVCRRAVVKKREGMIISTYGIGRDCMP